MKSRHEIVTGMCMTWRHDYGLEITDEMIEKYGAIALLGSGMTTADRKALYDRMNQLYEHDIKPLIERG